MLIADAQDELRQAYVGGGPGVVISGVVWLAAALFQHINGNGAGFAVLFFGGMFIFPFAKLVCRTVFHRPSESSSNPFGMTELEGTIAMIGGLFAAWLFLPLKPSLVFPLAAIAVGTHYLIFETVYGDRSFWMLAGIVTAIGFADIFTSQMRGMSPLLVSITEMAFGAGLVARALRANKVDA